MKFKKEKYNGEIWLPQQEDQKQFCTLEVVDNDIFLNTNLSTDLLSFKLNVVYGKFNDLGYLTFANCIVIESETGIINYKKINPDYTFVSTTHLIEPKGIRLKSIEIENNTINDLIRTDHTMNPLIDKVEIQSIPVTKIRLNNDLSLSLFKNYGIKTNKFGTHILNYGILKFDFDSEKSLLQAIEIYKQFQKFCIVFFSGIEKFNYFKSTCLKCGEKYNIIFRDNLAFKHHQGIINEFSFKDFADFPEVIANWYNNEDAKYCFDIIIENYLSKKVSNARRFTNSIASFEAFYKLFAKNKKHTQLNTRITEYENVFYLLDENIGNIKDFGIKMIRTRDYYVHSNREQKTEHNSLDLLYYSLLFDFLVIRELSIILGFSQEFMTKIESSFKSEIEHQKPINSLFNQNLIID